MKPELRYKDCPVYSSESKGAFYTWLGEHHNIEKVFWLRYYKKHTKIPSIISTDAVDVASCWGWIDGLINKYDDESYVVRFTPRRKKSVWSKVNVAKVAKLIESGAMTPFGLEHVTAAKADGRWDKAY